jgi:hypothetical protein
VALGEIQCFLRALLKLTGFRAWPLMNCHENVRFFKLDLTAQSGSFLTCPGPREAQHPVFSAGLERGVSIAVTIVISIGSMLSCMVTSEGHSATICSPPLVMSD